VVMAYWMQWKCRVDFDVFMGMHTSATRIIPSFFYSILCHECVMKFENQKKRNITSTGRN